MLITACANELATYPIIIPISKIISIRKIYFCLIICTIIYIPIAHIIASDKKKYIF